MTEGYLYCFSNESMPGLIKVGRTKRSPLERLKEANIPSTFGVPTPYKIEFAKKVSEHINKEYTIHKLLSKYTERINETEFFRTNVQDVKTFFDLIDGEWWVEECKKPEDESHQTLELSKRSHKNRDMRLCFKNDQQIRHMIGDDEFWTGLYDSTENVIRYNGESYKSLSSFAESHHKVVKKLDKRSANGWIECEYLVDGEWRSTDNIVLDES